MQRVDEKRRPCQLWGGISHAAVINLTKLDESRLADLVTRTLPSQM